MLQIKLNHKVFYENMIPAIWRLLSLSRMISAVKVTTMTALPCIILNVCLKTSIWNSLRSLKISLIVVNLQDITNLSNQKKRMGNKCTGLDNRLTPVETKLRTFTTVSAPSWSSQNVKDVSRMLCWILKNLRKQMVRTVSMRTEPSSVLY